MREKCEYGIKNLIYTFFVQYLVMLFKWNKMKHLILKIKEKIKFF